MAFLFEICRQIKIDCPVPRPCIVCNTILRSLGAYFLTPFYYLRDSESLKNQFVLSENKLKCRRDDL